MGGVWVVRVVRALTSNQCGPGSNPGVVAMYGSVKFVIGFLFCSQVFRRVLRFSPLLTNNLQSQGKVLWGRGCFKFQFD